MPKIVDKPSKRAEIARHAMELFARYGFEDTPIRKIAAHAGIGKGTIYDYFKDKEDILFEVVHLMFADWTELMVAKIGQMKDPLQQLIALVKEGSTLGDTFEQMMIIYMDIWRWSVSRKGSDEFIKKFRSFLIESKKVVAEMIEKAKDNGQIKKDLDSAAMAGVLIALIDGMCLHRMILQQDFNIDAACQTFFNSMLNGIQP
jgi:AcrR family transcriptional regulator